jgi:predicted nucleic acid-binding protein
VIVADSSAWIEFLRGTGSAVHLKLRQLVEEGDRLATTEVVVAEIVHGARTRADEDALLGRLLAFPLFPLEGLRSYLAAAELARACRAAGEPVRSLLDCLIAVPAIEHGATLLTADRDFGVLARHTVLELEPV